MHRCINIDQTTLFVIGDLGSQTLQVKGNMMNKKSFRVEQNQIFYFRNIFGFLKNQDKFKRHFGTFETFNFVLIRCIYVSELFEIFRKFLFIGTL